MSAIERSGDTEAPIRLGLSVEDTAVLMALAVDAADFASSPEASRRYRALSEKLGRALAGRPE